MKIRLVEVDSEEQTAWEEQAASGRRYHFLVGPRQVIVEMGVIGKSWEPISFDVRAYGPGKRRRSGPLTARELRGIPFGSLATLARARLRKDLAAEREAAGPEFFTDQAGRHRASIPAAGAARGLSMLERPRVGRPRIPRDELEKAAKAYLAAVERGSRSPTKDMGDQMHLTRSTANRWVQLLRDEGLLPPTRPGVGGYDIEA